MKYLRFSFFLRANFIEADPDPVHSVPSIRNTLCSNINTFIYRRRILHTTTQNSAASKLMSCFFMELIFHGFKAGKSITRGIGRGGPWKSQLFWARFPGPTPSNAPRNRSCPPQNHYVPRHINNRYRYINS
jgi:hypothetical protein